VVENAVLTEGLRDVLEFDIRRQFPVAGHVAVCQFSLGVISDHVSHLR
jgi:hypothetical protein